MSVNFLFVFDHLLFVLPDWLHKVKKFRPETLPLDKQFFQIYLFEMRNLWKIQRDSKYTNLNTMMSICIFHLDVSNLSFCSFIYDPFHFQMYVCVCVWFVQMTGFFRKPMKIHQKNVNHLEIKARAIWVIELDICQTHKMNDAIHTKISASSFENQIILFVNLTHLAVLNLFAMYMYTYSIPFHFYW